MEDGRCPSCGKPVISGERCEFTKVTVFQGDEPGKTCMKCGVTTSLRVRISRKTRNANYQPRSSSKLDAHPLALLINFFAGKYHQAVEVIVPVCAACQKSASLDPKYIDFEKRSMTFVGHRAWKEDQQCRLK
jgi:hypothetical protein